MRVAVLRAWLLLSVLLFALPAFPICNDCGGEAARLCGPRLLLLFIVHMRSEDAAAPRVVTVLGSDDDALTLRHAVASRRGREAQSWAMDTAQVLWRQIAALPPFSDERAAIVRELFVFMNESFPTVVGTDEAATAWEELRHALWLARKFQERGVQSSWSSFYLAWLFAFFDRNDLWNATPDRLVEAWIALRHERFVTVP